MCNRSDGEIPADLCRPATQSPYPPSHVSELLSEADVFLIESIGELLRLHPVLIAKLAAHLNTLLLEIGH